MSVVISCYNFMVDDVELMARFYREVFEWSHQADLDEAIGDISLCGDRAGRRVRRLVMRGLNPDIGKIALIQGDWPCELPVTYPRQRLGLGDIAVVADVGDIFALAERVRKFPGATIVTAPIEWSFPAPDGSGMLLLTSMNFFDPAGFLHEVYYRRNRPNPAGYLVRRCTAMVADNRATIDVYRDILGLTVIQDSTMKNEGMVLPVNLVDDGARAMMHFTVCKAAHPQIGMIGALEFTEPRLPLVKRNPQIFQAGRLIVSGECNDMAHFTASAAARNVNLFGPLTTSLPTSPPGTENISASRAFVDPGGVVWSVAAK